MIDDKSPGLLFKGLDLFSEFWITGEVNLIKLILINKIFSDVGKIVKGRSVFSLGVSE